MSSFFTVAILLLSLLGKALGGAALVQPKPWSTDESSTRPCGAGSYTTKVSASFPVGSNQTCVWWVVSGAGLGQVHARIDPKGGTNFTYGIPIGFKQPTFTTVGYYTISFVVPYVLCTGTNNTCTMQFWTDSGGGWYACTTLDITCHGCTGGVPVSRDECVTANSLSFCTNKDGTQVYVPTGEDANQIDGLVSHYYAINLPDPTIFTNGNSTQCMSMYKEMMCELYLAPCGSSPASSYTQQQCQQTLTTCGLTQAQSGLYNCSIFPSVITSTGGMTSTTTTTTTTTTSSSSSSALLDPLAGIFYLLVVPLLFL